MPCLVNMDFVTVHCCVFLFLIFLYSSSESVTEKYSAKSMHIDTKVVTKLAGAEQLEIKSAPFIMGVVVLMNNSLFSICTGTLIDPSWVLTAAHCFDDFTDVMVVGGISDVNKTKGHFQFKMVEKKIRHHKFLKKFYFYDIGLLKVATPFNISSYVNVISLSNDKWPQDTQMYNRSCSVVGWVGNTSPGKHFSKKVFRINVTARHGENGCPCIKMFFNARLVCINIYSENVGLCKGASGAPLICDNKAVGVTHSVYSLEICKISKTKWKKFDCATGTTIFVYICPLLGWLKTNVPSAPSMPLSCKGQTLNNNLLFIFIISIKFILTYFLILFEIYY